MSPCTFPKTFGSQVDLDPPQPARIISKILKIVQCPEIQDSKDSRIQTEK